MDNNSDFNFATVIHEILHSLALKHEHQRNDRNEYVDINYPAIEPELRDNDNKTYLSNNIDKLSEKEFNTYEVPYDYSSVMHYCPKCGAVEGQTVFTAKDQRYQTSMGQEIGPTFNDLQKVNRRYCLKQVIL